MTHLREQVVQPQDNSIRYIPLTKGQVAIVDAADYDWLRRWRWQAHWAKDTGSYYARRGIRDKVSGKHRQIKMHHLILGLKHGERGDHRNRNTLDNRRENLRLATPRQNAQNRAKQETYSNPYKGVSMRKKVTERWIARIKTPEERLYLGMFGTAEAAARAYDEAARKYFGEFAVLNFP